MEDGDLKVLIEAVAEDAKKYLELTPRDIEALRKAKPKIEPAIDSAVEKVASLLREEDEMRQLAEKTGIDEAYLKSLFRSWLTDLFDNSYDADHAYRLARIGLAHIKVPAAGRLIVLTTGAFLAELLRLAEEPREALALAKAVMWNLAIITFIYEKVRESMYGYFVGDKSALMERLVELFSREVEKELDHAGVPSEA